MIITRNNYEDFFMLYADNELSAADKKAVEAFVIQNPDLEKELLMVQQTILKPDNNIVFENKNSLMKQTFSDSIININNYEEYFLLYTDNELDKSARKDVESFASQNPSLQEELNILLQTKSTPDPQIIFEGKEILYKVEKDDKVIPVMWWRVAAAAAVLLLVGFFIFNNKTNNSGTVAKTNETKINQPKNNAATVIDSNKKEDAVVTSSSVAPLNTTEAISKEEKVKNKKLDEFVINQSKKENSNRENKPGNSLPENNPVEIKKNEIARVDHPKNETVAENPVINTISNTVVSKADNTVAAATDNKNDEPNYARQALQTNNNTNPDDVFYVANTSSKKSKLRGIFRKVSRVFDKTANADNDDNKHGILIGSFQIALK
jgi:hypothetical protein